MSTGLLSTGLILLFKSNSHCTTFLSLSLSNILVSIGLVNLQCSTDILTYINISNINRENLKGRTCIKTLAEHQLRD